MKNKTITTTLALSLIFGTFPAFADGGAASTPATTGVTTTVTQTTQVKTVDPNSFLYSLKEILTQLKLALTFNEKEKADLLIKQANDKISELEALQKNGNEQHNEEYSKKINEILKKTDDVLKTASAHIEDKDKVTKEKEQIELEKKHEALTEVEKHSLVVLKANLDKVPKPGQKGIANAIAKQEAKLQTQTTPPANEDTTGETSVEQTTNVQQTVSVQTAPTASVPTESTTSTSVQAQPEDTRTEKEHVKVKHDNGLHLGQIKHQEEKHDHKK